MQSSRALLSLALTSVLALGASDASASTVVVTQSGFGFTPANVTIQVGDTVRWQWTTLSHTVTEGTDGLINGNEAFAGVLHAGNPVYEFVFDAAFVAANPRPGGKFDYFCMPHFPAMTGTVTIAAVGLDYCFGDGTTTTPCPCGNVGAAGRGCENSAASGGARLVANGSPAADALVLTSSGELATALSIFLQGNLNNTSGAVFGDGVRCVAGSLKRIGVNNAAAGVAHYPHVGDPSISTRSAVLGDPLAPGSTRFYQTYYRDADLSFCPGPAGSTFNISNAVEIAW